MSWSPDTVVAAVRDTLGGHNPPFSSWTFVRAHRELDGVLVVFRARASCFGVRYTLSDLPHGANTGLRCATPEMWAHEVILDPDEQIGTGGLDRAERSVTPDGLTVLRWRW